MKQAIQNPAGGALFAGQSVGLLGLADNLILAQHHRIQPGDNAEPMPPRLLVRKLVEVILEHLRRQIVRLGDEADDIVEIRNFGWAGNDDFHPVASAEDSGFATGKLLLENHQSGGNTSGRKPLPSHFHRRGAMI